MRTVFRVGFAFALTFLGVQPAVPQTSEDLFYRERVEYEDGKISVDFERTPLPIALNAIQIKTGFEITLPPATASKFLSLRLSQLPLEPAVRSLLTSVGFRNFALLYDEEGYPKRAVVLESRPEARATSPADPKVASPTEAVVEPLRAQERAQLHKELEHWEDLKQEDRTRIEARLKTLPPSEDREQLVTEYGRQLLGIKN